MSCDQHSSLRYSTKRLYKYVLLPYFNIVKTNSKCRISGRSWLGTYARLDGQRYRCAFSVTLQSLYLGMRLFVCLFVCAGLVYVWGCGYKDSRRGLVPPVLGLGHNEGRTSPERLSALDNMRIKSVACGWDHCIALDSRGRMFSWGSGQNGI